MISIFMNTKIPYYKLLDGKAHKKIFGTDEAQSIFELIFLAEAPTYIGTRNVWPYVTWINWDEIRSKVDRFASVDSYRISEDETKKYPYKLLTYMLLMAPVKSPLIFETVKGGYRCIEGAHRLRILRWLNHCEAVTTPVPALIVRKIDEKEEGGRPKRWDLFEAWRHERGLQPMYQAVEKLFENFMEKSCTARTS